MTNTHRCAIAVTAAMMILAVVAFWTAPSSACPMTQEQLDKFAAVARIWNNKVNGDVANYLAAFDYFDENGTFEVDYVGKFEGKTLGEEYGLILWVVPNVRLQSDGVYDASIKWYAENTISYSWNYSIYNLQTDGQYFAFHNLKPTEYLTFRDDSCDNPIITYSLTIEDPIAKMVFTLGSTNRFQYEAICGLIGAMCTGPNLQYADFGDCLDKFHTNFSVGDENDAVCPYSLSGNTALCRQNHALITTTDPPTSQNLHCMHTGTNPAMTPCHDICLPDCNACSIPASLSPKGYPIRNVSSHAHCTPTYNGPVASFSCLCDAGTLLRPDLTTPGKIYCQPLTCHCDRDCRSKDGWATCSNNTCQPLDGFTWDPSQRAYDKRNTVQCAYGKDRVYTGLDGTDRCVPPGSCIVGSRNAQKQCTSALKDHNERKSVRCVDLDNQDSVPLGRYGGCICTDRQGNDYPCPA